MLFLFDHDIVAVVAAIDAHGTLQEAADFPEANHLLVALLTSANLIGTVGLLGLRHFRTHKRLGPREQPGS